MKKSPKLFFNDANGEDEASTHHYHYCWKDVEQPIVVVVEFVVVVLQMHLRTVVVVQANQRQRTNDVVIQL